jgi:flagellar secretion chaperone FliS
MWNQAHNAYLESRILTADPMELVRLMYQAAIGELRTARVHLANRDVRARAQAISKACAILTELTIALDRKAGGQYAERLADLYGYMMRQLTEANLHQRDEGLAEVLGLFTTLLEGWEGAQSQLGSQAQSSPETPAAAWSHAQETAYTPHAWSF